ncbi:hypothetical protein LGQ02_05685 [Bacillus shivajii]|uniref:hypothetical protein n=1 Tax=Bacillus shivajii TaxID=1983719 RepID=UPI001CF9E9BF|nr:hypothetical protein [Bacillus shivajii]UCZ54254.1 hypothetical protein LGQ02_05685 [Bacillus shivajii]
MFHKGLGYQNYKQTRMIMSMIFVLFTIHLPFQALLTLESWRTEKEYFSEFHNQPFEVFTYQIHQIFSAGLLPFLVAVAIILLAGLLIGTERNTRRNDFTFSLPFRRREIYLSKTIYGASCISFFHTFHFMLAYFIVKQSEFSYVLERVTLTEIFWGPLIGFLLLFTFSMFIGTIAGEMISQVFLTFIFAVFPTGFWILLQGLIDVNFSTYVNIPIFIDQLTIFSYLFWHNPSTQSVIFGLVGIALAIFLGVILYERNRVEHNGEFLIFKQLHPIFLTGMIICFSLLGGVIMASLAPWNAETLRIISYWIGFFTFMIFADYISQKILRMNVIVKNK